MVKVFLHIGMNKTGSTAIQKFFGKNQDALKQRGLLWPDLGFGGGPHYGLSDALGFGARKSLVDDGENISALRTALDREIEEANPQTLVMSSEKFVKQRDHLPVFRFFKGLDVRVIVYLRRHDEWWPSLYAQAVKTVSNPPWNRSFQSFFDHQSRRKTQYFVFGELLNDLAAVFGHDRIIVCPYEDAQNQPNLIGHFLHQVERPDLVQLSEEDEQRVNVALSPRTLSLIDWTQRAKIDQETKGVIIRTILNEDKAETSPPLVPAALRRQLALEQAEDYKQIARDYLGRDNGVLFKAPLPEDDGRKGNGGLPNVNPVDFFASYFHAPPEAVTKSNVKEDNFANKSRSIWSRFSKK